MITLIILTVVAVIMLLIGFFEVRLPFINRGNVEKKAVLMTGNGSKKLNKEETEPVKSIKAFYMTVRAENWLSNTQRRMTSDVA